LTRNVGTLELRRDGYVSCWKGAETVMRTARAFTFLFKAPLILALLFVINLMTSPGQWWVQWAALGLGIAWVVSLLRVIRAIVLAGGLAAIGALVLKNRQ
jgi:hypothetical protein